MCDADFNTSAVIATWIHFSLVLMAVNRLWFSGHCSGWWNNYNQFLSNFLILIVRICCSPFETNSLFMTTMCVHFVLYCKFLYLGLYSGHCYEMLQYFIVLLWWLPPYILKHTNLAFVSHVRNILSILAAVLFCNGSKLMLMEMYELKWYISHEAFLLGYISVKNFHFKFKVIKHLQGLSGLRCLETLVLNMEIRLDHMIIWSFTVVSSIDIL